MRLPSLRRRRSAKRLVGLLALLVAAGCAGPAPQRDSAGTARIEPRTAPDGAQRPPAGARTGPRQAAQPPGRRTVPPAAVRSPGALPPEAPSSGDAPAGPPPESGRGGGYYLDDGPPTDAPPDLESIGDAQPRTEPLHPRANRPYTVFGRQYVPMTLVTVHRQRGIASWYGRRFHGRRTASGERYDMYGMTAAHPTLPIPSYVRVTNLRNGRSVVVRVNDRGPFLRNRAIDLSYAAALKLDYVRAGSTEVDIELVRPDDLQPPQQPERAPQPQRPQQQLDQVASAASAETASVEAAAASGRATSGSTASTESTGATGAAGMPDAADATEPADATADATGSTGVATTREPDRSPRLTIETIIAEAAPVAASVPASAPVGSNYLQLGAFTTRARAEAARARFRREFGWLKARIEVVAADERVYRVQAGPWPSRDEALRIAERIADALSERPVAVVR